MFKPAASRHKQENKHKTKITHKTKNKTYIIAHIKLGTDDIGGHKLQTI